MERWDLYDENRKLLPYDIQRGDEIPEGCYHLCVETWLINEKGEVLITQRHPGKERYALCWECSGGGVRKGEESAKAAFRELQEETGLKLDPEHHFYLGSYRGDNWFMDTYVYFLQGEGYPELNLQQEEVAAAKWVTPEQLKEEKNVIPDKIERFFQYLPEIEERKAEKQER